jgi:hypothetical protein
MNSEQEKKQSPAKEIVDKNAVTDRTSRLIYKLEEQLSEQRTMRLVRNFLLAKPQQIAVRLGMGHRLDRKGNIDEPIQLQTFGYFAGAGVFLPQWRYGYRIARGQMVPRLLVTTSVRPSDMILDQNLLSSGFNDNPVMTKFRYRPIRLMATLTFKGEVIWDWTDLEQVEENSFRIRMQCLVYSLRELLDHTIPLILFGKKHNSLASSLHL